MDTVLDLIVSFAATGEAAGLRIGMPGGEADALLGGGTGLDRAPRSPAQGMTGFKDGSLEVWIGADGKIGLLGFDRAGTDGGFLAPARVGGVAGREHGDAVTYGVITGRLAARGCVWSRDEALTFDDQLAIRTEADVSLTFTRPGSGSDGRGGLLANLYTSWSTPAG
ncbi:hypothetical protein GCM10018781_28550 [Kitasatospora indigofera]|uniref:Uncharacterized protein n=1 Tax=Kitasatospora indigofera TaxID=67307 RepID=A0A919FP22_9ACTN|nr:hypothetical protein [Kitasatospora indigofera]GHH69683.1 hypothetical protein GCM10018781_28550 [Kitasatospora indigofera]